MQGETSDEVLGAVKLLADSVPDGGSYVQVQGPKDMSRD